MTVTKADLYLGGSLGEWVLNITAAENIKNVFTFDRTIFDSAEKNGLIAHLGDANQILFSPAAIGFSIHYPKILHTKILDRYIRTYNLHPGYLPWGQGYFPVFWALWEKTPAGATLQEMVEKVDQGPIIAQVEVPYSSEDTGGSLHKRVRDAEKELFMQYWPRIISGDFLVGSSQSPAQGSYHSKKEFFELKQLSNWETMSGNDILHLVRCLTFPGYTGLEIIIGRKKFELKLNPLDEVG